MLGALAAVVAGVAAAAGVSATGGKSETGAAAKHVLLLSVDGLHQSDLAWYVNYDDSFNHSLLPAGTTSCAGVTPGTEVTYFEQADRNPTALDAGQCLPGLPDSILQMSGSATSLVDPAQLPVDPATCRPVYPPRTSR
jgi:hypothetical protein